MGKSGMIIALTGAFNNVGDHLIGERAIKLLRTIHKDKIINLNRRRINEPQKKLLEKARIVVLCGGPAYQTRIFPDIYPINYRQISCPIIPMALGWKAAIEQKKEDFSFSQPSQTFINDIHQNIRYSSCRDNLTLELLQSKGIDNVLMTGCSAWYDLDFLGSSAVFESKVETIIVSAPFKMNPQFHSILSLLAQRFPKAQKFCTFHHGFIPNNTVHGAYKSFGFLQMLLWGYRYGFRPLNLCRNIEKLSVYDIPNSLHVGYRVHAHIYRLSKGRASFLINEDSRGIGQAKSLGLPILNANQVNLPSALKAELDTHFLSKGEAIQNAKHTINETYQIMKIFIESFL